MAGTAWGLTHLQLNKLQWILADLLTVARGMGSVANFEKGPKARETFCVKGFLELLS